MEHIKPKASSFERQRPEVDRSAFRDVTTGLSGCSAPRVPLAAKRSAHFLLATCPSPPSKKEIP